MKLLAKEKKGWFQAKLLFFREDPLGGLTMVTLSPLWEVGKRMERAHVTDYLIGADEKIPD